MCLCAAERPRAGKSLGNEPREPKSPDWSCWEVQCWGSSEGSAGFCGEVAARCPAARARVSPAAERNQGSEVRLKQKENRDEFLSCSLQEMDLFSFSLCLWVMTGEVILVF